MKFLQRLKKTAELIFVFWVASGVLSEAQADSLDVNKEDFDSLRGQDVSTERNKTGAQSSFYKVQRAKAMQDHPGIRQAAKRLNEITAQVNRQILLEDTSINYLLVSENLGDDASNDEFPGRRVGGGTRNTESLLLNDDELAKRRGPNWPGRLNDEETLVAEGGDEFPGQRRGGGTHATEDDDNGTGTTA